MFVVQKEDPQTHREVVELLGPFETVEEISQWAKGAGLEVFDEGVWCTTNKYESCMPGSPYFFYTYRELTTPRYELFYGTGGHGGPYHGLKSALEAAKSLVEGKSESLIHVFDYTRWPNTSKPGHTYYPVATVQRKLQTEIVETVEVNY